MSRKSWPHLHIAWYRCTTPAFLYEYLFKNVTLWNRVSGIFLAVAEAGTAWQRVQRAPKIDCQCCCIQSLNTLAKGCYESFAGILARCQCERCNGSMVASVVLIQKYSQYLCSSAFVYFYLWYNNSCNISFCLCAWRYSFLFCKVVVSWMTPIQFISWGNSHLRWHWITSCRTVQIYLHLLYIRISVSVCVNNTKRFGIFQPSRRGQGTSTDRLHIPVQQESHVLFHLQRIFLLPSWCPRLHQPKKQLSVPTGTYEKHK